MRLPFLDREKESLRLSRALDAKQSALLCLYGRRRLGKSRLLHQVLKGRTGVYYVGDERDAALQRADLAAQIAGLVPGFEQVDYPSWNALLERWWQDAPEQAVLTLDEFPALVSTAPELPSLLQKYIDRPGKGVRHIVLCGSSQRMMMGLLLDGSAPLFGRARELLKVEPMGPKWLRTALDLRRVQDVVAHWAVWGGVPRYWELAAEYDDLWQAVEHLMLDPMGVLHREPSQLLLDDLREVTRAASILALIGRGCHRGSEIAGRLGVPATSLSRPLSRLIELGFVARDLPFGTPKRSGKKTLYRVADPLLRFWYRFVEPNRSRLAAGQISQVNAEVQRAWPQFLGQAWELLVRQTVANLRVAGHDWLPAQRWWGRETELDIVAQSATEPSRVLVGEAKLRCTAKQVDGLLSSLENKARQCPVLRDKQLMPALFVLSIAGGRSRRNVITARNILLASR